MRGAFITFEGIEGSGKTTQVRRLASRIESAGGRVLVTREPGGTPAADAVRAVLLDPASAGLAPEAELLLYAACRADHVRRVVLPALASGTHVACDRFSDSTRAYQGAARGLAPEAVESVDAFARAGLVPDVTLLLDLPVEDGLARASGRTREAAGGQGAAPDRLEAEDIAFHRRVRSAFLRLAKEEPRRIWVIDARGSVEDVADRVARAVARVLPRLVTA